MSISIICGNGDVLRRDRHRRSRTNINPPLTPIGAWPDFLPITQPFLAGGGPEDPRGLADLGSAAGSITLRDLRVAKQFAADNRMTVLMGVTTASLMDDEAIANSSELESDLRRNADHWVKLYRPQLYRATADIRPGERNVVELTGTSPAWWGTRCSKLRFDPRGLGFSTVV